jgi:hypothetical protein
MRYGWKRKIKGLSAQIAGEAIESIIQRGNGYIEPMDIVNEARPETNPLHCAFEWDNDKAAEAYRIEQARYLMRILVIVTSNGDEEPIITRAFVNVLDEEEESRFTTIQRAIENKDEWEYVIKQAYNELQTWREKYKTLKLFENIFNAIDSVKIN